MKKVKKLISLILAFVIAFSSLTLVQSFAADDNIKSLRNDIYIEIKTEKDSYSNDELVPIIMTVTNKSSTNYENISVEMAYNETRLDCRQGSEIAVGSLRAGESKDVEIDINYANRSIFARIFLYFIRFWRLFQRAVIGSDSETTRFYVKIGMVNYQLVFSIKNGEVGSSQVDPELPVEDSIELSIDRSDFETKEINARITGTVTTTTGIDTIEYKSYAEVDAGNLSYRGDIFLDGNNWYFDLTLKPGKNAVTVNAKTSNGLTATKTITVNYNIGSISAGNASDYATEQNITYRKGVLVIYFDDNITEDVANNIIVTNGGRVIGQNYFLNFYQAKFDIDGYTALKQKADYFKTLAGVKAADVSCVEEASISINDPWNSDVDNTDWNDNDVDGSNWGLEAIDMKSVWANDSRLSRQPTRIGCVDSTLNTAHSEFANTSDNINVIMMNNNQNYSSDHGSHVSGIMAASPDNGTGVTGIVWNGNLYFGSAAISSRGLSRDLIVDNLTKAVICGAKVVNFSAGNRAGECMDHAVIIETKLLDKGFDFLFVQAAGNDTVDATKNGWFCSITADTDVSFATSRYSAQDLIDHTIVVASVDNDKRNNGYSFSDFSNYGNRVDIAAPGGDIYSCYFNGTDYMSGTSMAAPHVTAVAGLMWSANNTLSMTEIKEILCDEDYTTQAYDYIHGKAYRMLNAGLAVNRAFELADALGTLNGRFVDAATSEAIASGTYIIHKETATGEAFGSTHSFSNGYFTFDAPGGRYVLEISGSGNYVKKYLTVIVVPNDTAYLGDIALSKSLGDNQLRIVLSWGENPSDLDSHIVGKTTSMNDFHVLYCNDRYYEDENCVVWLDVDDISSYGPETITVVDMSKVKSFTYLVHNYSDKEDGSEDDGAFNLSDSGATVDVYRGTELIRSYSVPVNRKGTVWKVFSMDENGIITNYNTMDYESEPSEVGY